MQDLMGKLISDLGIEASLLENVEITGVPPELGTRLRVSHVAAAALGVQAALIIEIWRRQTGRTQQARITLDRASLSMQSVLLQTVWSYPVVLPEANYPTVGIYPTLDERFILINGGYPLLRDGLLRLLNCASDADAIGNSISRREAFVLEEDIAAHGLCGVVVRSAAEWRTHAQGEALSTHPVIDIVRLNDTDPIPLPSGERPLQGVRVLDLTHVIAGPTISKCLAEQGASVLHICDPSRPQLPPFDRDSNHGKRSAYLDLRRQQDAACLSDLAQTSDVFVQSYRPGAISGLGFSAEQLARQRPGIIVVSVSCFGFSGPWRQRRGFEQLAQAATGMAQVHGTADNPQLCPGIFPNDYITGFLGACGILAALLRRSEEGGSYHVRVSLCRTAMLILEAGLLDIHTKRKPIDRAVTESVMQQADTAVGKLRFLGPIIDFDETAPRWLLPPAPLGAHPAIWQ